MTGVRDTPNHKTVGLASRRSFLGERLWRKATPLEKFSKICPGGRELEFIIETFGVGKEGVLRALLP